MSDDRDILGRLSADDQTPPASDATPIPVRVEPDPRAAAEDALNRANEAAYEGDEVVREYETKYYGDTETKRKRMHAEELAGQVAGQVKERLSAYDWQPHAYATSGLTDEEKLWAALAHASFALTLGLIMISGGTAALALALIFVPLAIYLSFRDRSEFVARQAMQAFALQIVGTVGWLAIMVGGSILFALAIVVSAIASIVLIGIPFLIIFVVLFVVFVLLMVVAPLGLLGFSIVAAVNAYSGKDFRYPFIASWIDRQYNQPDTIL